MSQEETLSHALENYLEACNLSASKQAKRYWIDEDYVRQVKEELKPQAYARELEELKLTIKKIDAILNAKYRNKDAKHFYLEMRNTITPIAEEKEALREKFS